MRLGGPVVGPFENPDAWVAGLRELGYGAAYCPVGLDDGEDVVRGYAEAADQAGIVIAEVGAWSNPVARDDDERKKAIAKCERQLALADLAGARCCVNIAGSRGETWDGPDADNLTPETFDLIVETVRGIIDAVKPTRTYYTLETMPWMYPDSPDAYVDLIQAIDRERFAAHLDPVNLVCSPQRYFGNAALIRECFAKLGPYIKSSHGKDILLHKTLTTHLDEARPGLGGLDYGVYLEELERLGPDTPLMLEHLRSADEYRLAADHVRKVAAEVGVPIVT